MKTNLLLLSEPMVLETHACTDILTKLANLSLSMNPNCMNSQHADLLDDSNPNLKIEGT